MLLDQITLMLRLQAAAPVAGEFELAARSLQYFDALGVVETLEVVFQHEVQAVQQSVVPHLVHEFEVLGAVVQRIPDQVLEEILGQLHVVLQLIEGGLRLDHPELRRMARSVGILGAERGTEGVDAAQRQRTQLAFELARHGQVAGLAEEVLREIDLSLLILGHVVQVERRHLKHGACALAVRSRDKRRMEVIETLPVEIFVNGVGHGVPDAQHRAEGIGARTQVGDVAQELQRMPLFLQGIGLRIGRAVDLDLLGLHLDALARSERRHEPSVHTDAGARGDGFELLFAELGKIDHYLDIRNARSVIEGDERHILVSALGAHPTFDDDVGVHDARLQNLYDSLRFHSLFFTRFPN